jgi:hypothetical protein
VVEVLVVIRSLSDVAAIAKLEKASAVLVYNEFEWVLGAAL